MEAIKATLIGWQVFLADIQDSNIIYPKMHLYKK